MANAKISTGKIDEAAPLAATEASPFLGDIDPSKIRVFTGTIESGPGYLLGGFSGSSSPYSLIVSGEIVDGEGPNGTAQGSPFTLAQEQSVLTPQLSDISIKSQEVDWTTTPPTVKVVLRVKNSTGKEVIGLKGLRSA